MELHPPWSALQWDPGCVEQRLVSVPAENMVTVKGFDKCKSRPLHTVWYRSGGGMVHKHRTSAMPPEVLHACLVLDALEDSARYSRLLQRSWKLLEALYVQHVACGIPHVAYSL